MRYLMLIILLAACTSQANESEYRTGIVNIMSDGEIHEFEVKVPTTQNGFMKGLMYRENLDNDKGMLFAFENNAPRSFWMKNTLIPLDIMFIGENLTIINIEYAVPCEVDPCPTYKSTSPAKFVLEINAGLSNELNIDAGDSVQISVS